MRPRGHPKQSAFQIGSPAASAFSRRGDGYRTSHGGSWGQLSWYRRPARCRRPHAPGGPKSTPTQARHCLAYVLNNWRRHRADRAPWAQTARVDPYSSGAVFPGWAERDGVPFRWSAGYQPAPVRPPDTWLLRIGWRRGGPPPSLDEVPGPFV